MKKENKINILVRKKIVNVTNKKKGKKIPLRKRKIFCYEKKICLRYKQIKKIFLQDKSIKKCIEPMT